MSADLQVLLDRVARAVESVVPGLALTPELGRLVWLEDDMTTGDGTSVGTDGGEWVRWVGVRICYRGDDLGAFEHRSGGSDRERLLAVALQLISTVQDVVAETTTEPWPMIVVQRAV